MMKLALILAVALGVLTLANAAEAQRRPLPPQDVVRIEHIAVRLVYERTGAFSADIAPPAEFSLWNTVIGGGEAAEPASDILVQVSLRAPEETNANRPLVVTVRGPQGVIATRTFAGVFLGGGRAVRSLIVHDVTCRGRVTIEARYGTRRQATTIPFNCGE
jgi:hypothetical protein